MEFIDELIRQGGLPYGMEVEEEPKAYDAIDSIIDIPYKEDILGLFTGGGIGGGANIGKGLRQLILALKGKIKGGKMIPSQPIRKGIVGGGKSKTLSDLSYSDKQIVDFSKRQLWRNKSNQSGLSSPVSGLKNIEVEKTGNLLKRMFKIESEDPVSNIGPLAVLLATIAYRIKLKNTQKRLGVDPWVGAEGK